MKNKNSSLYSLGVFAVALGLSGCGGGDNNTSDDTSKNIPPNASALISGEKHIGYSLQFDASSSQDEDGSIEKYRWEESGEVLSEAAIFSKVFLKDGMHSVTLYVTDNSGEQSSVTKTFNLENFSPVAKISGPSKNTKNITGRDIYFDGSNSFDKKGKVISFLWTESGEKLSSSKNFKKSDFSIGKHIVTLTVTDAHQNQNQLDYSFEVTAPGAEQLPHAYISNVPVSYDDRIIHSENDIEFDGSGSRDPDGQVASYQWLLQDKAVGSDSKITLSKLDAGNYTLKLQVTDDEGFTDSDVKNFKVIDIAQWPIAELGPDLTFPESDKLVVRSKPQTADSEFKFSWFLDGTNLNYTSAGSEKLIRSLPVGQHTVGLKVRAAEDGSQVYAYDEIRVRVQEDSKYQGADAGSNLVVNHGAAVELDASESAAIDASIVSYRWTENNKQVSDQKTYRIDNLNEGIHYFILKTMDDQGYQSSDHKIVKVKTTHKEIANIKLNDTGVIRAGIEVCDSSNLAHQYTQDCASGRDFTANDDRDGKAGFSFTKLDDAGKPLPKDAQEWSCVKDNVTGLVWEVKQANPYRLYSAQSLELHDSQDTFSWFEIDPAIIGQLTDKGVENKAQRCFGFEVDRPETWCNSLAFTYRADKENLCGLNGWRLPQANELLNLVDFSDSKIITHKGGYFVSYKADSEDEVQQIWSSTLGDISDLVITFDELLFNDAFMNSEQTVILVHDAKEQK